MEWCGTYGHSSVSGTCSPSPGGLEHDEEMYSLEDIYCELLSCWYQDRVLWVVSGSELLCWYVSTPWLNPFPWHWKEIFFKDMGNDQVLAAVSLLLDILFSLLWMLLYMLWLCSKWSFLICVGPCIWWSLICSRRWVFCLLVGLVPLRYPSDQLLQISNVSRFFLSHLDNLTHRVIVWNVQIFSIIFYLAELLAASSSIGKSELCNLCKWFVLFALPWLDVLTIDALWCPQFLC